MWANTQRDDRPAEYRWRPLFSGATPSYEGKQQPMMGRICEAGFRTGVKERMVRVDSVTSVRHDASEA